MKRILTLIVLMLITLSGCSNILIADNVALTVRNEEPKIADIKAFVTQQPGQVSSIAADDKSLYSIGHTGGVYTIDQFDLESSNLVNLITSNTKILDVAAASDGLYYLKETPSGSIQIVWSSNNRLIERTVSDPVENPQEVICVYNNKDIIYFNNANELIFSDSVGAKKSYSFNETLEVEKLYWVERIHTGFILAKEADSEITNLYRCSLEDDRINLKVIEKNVIDMTLNDKQDQLVYATNANDSVHVYLRGGQYFDTVEEKFSTDNLECINFSHDSEKLYFLKNDENKELSTIWCYTFSEKQLYQLSSPLRITSSIFSPSNDDEIYFSVDKVSATQPTISTQPNSYIIELVYELQK